MALALTLRGIDDWTRQFFDEPWVEKAQESMMNEINSSSGPVVLSSERLAAMTPDQIILFKTLFAEFDIHVILVWRDVDSYLSSTWRHAVYRHDFAETYEDFLDRFENFSFGSAQTKFKQHFDVHDFNIDAADYASSLGELIGTTLEIPRANVGIPLEFAKLLQTTHALLGSEEFKKRFDSATKKNMLAVWNGQSVVEIEPMAAPLF